MGKRILIIQGHPDGSTPHLCHALARAYVDGAERGGHQVRALDVAALDFPLLRSQQDWEHGSLPAGLIESQQALAWCEHLLLVFPLWLGEMPALLKAWLEQVARPGFAFKAEGANPFAQKGLSGRSARIVVTMGMPALVYRFFYRAHSLRSLERNILGFVGIAPIQETLIGMVEQLGPTGAEKQFKRLRQLGQRGV
ncbi:NAD(P)H-dependent oxidoreductase [Paucibacter sp. APW11]|uniref:NAD(P)H-dependent oxidoreductase n=1 Tax=Roseateles aquae TaxID=3077235 RepID=A0ABU3PCE5_9BURK|nr:NAD(P)H-dependent oxidoreductase [Paucibacter sp. APW11]MDT8999975.1 NAD(P)H-dependent oxidoreductase [Paucibacter sp. APW11]